MIKIFIICSGLGRIKRGFESFSQECFDVLSKETSLDITLFKNGGGKSKGREIVLWNLPRDTWVAIKLGKLIKRGAYFVEQATFFLSLLPYIYCSKPNVIYFSDGNLGNLLWYWRNLAKQKYKLLFCNGAPFSPDFVPYSDYIQQVTPHNFQIATKAGIPSAKQTMIPHGIYIPEELQIPPTTEKWILKKKLRLPQNKPIILSVGSINKSHKRMDYLICAIDSLPEPRPYLLLLGQQNGESPEIIQLGNRLLGIDNFQVRTVAKDEVADYYKVADVFVLASLSEGFGLVLAEALSYGLPCLAHDYEISRFVLGDKGYFADFKIKGNLANLISNGLRENTDSSKYYIRHRSVYERFSWERLCPSYVEMFHHCANLKVPV